MENIPIRRFFVVIHTLTNGLNHVIEQTSLAKEAGADGVFLIPDYAKGKKKATTDDQFLYLEELKKMALSFSIGVNFLRRPEAIVPRIYTASPDLLQTDSNSIDGIDRTKLEGTELFLGLAFKYSKYVHATGDVLKAQCEKVSALADVPTTSGDATGRTADLRKIREIRSYLPVGKRLGIASGVTGENVEAFLKEGVTDFLVTTSLIEKVNPVDGFDLLSSSKVSEMADAIHAY